MDKKVFIWGYCPECGYANSNRFDIMCSACGYVWDSRAYEALTGRKESGVSDMRKLKKDKEKKEQKL